MQLFALILTLFAPIALNSGKITVQDSPVPVFEINVNGKTLTAMDPVWKDGGKRTKSLANGGLVTTYRFEGKGRWSGLILEWDRETFGNEDFVRERLRISSGTPGKFRFTDKDGRCSLIFPQYMLNGQAEEAEEIRIATFDKEALDGYDENTAWIQRAPRNNSGCHMFHPDYIRHEIPCSVKGPFLTATVGGRKVLTSYEHASQDNTWHGNIAGNDDAVLHKNHYTERVYDEDLRFIETSLKNTPEGAVISSEIIRGAYLESEPIPSGKFYETVWYTLSRPEGSVDDAIHDYLFSKITDNSLARRPDFYYNTWGYQREQKQPQASFTEEAILKEISSAAKLGIDTFIFDDGWQQELGDWTPNRDRLPNGLKPLVNALEAKGITPGIWLGLIICDPELPIAKQHPDWVMKDRNGAPYVGGWGKPAMDITTGYYDYLLAQLKALTDQGIRFFKWDGIDFSLNGLAHTDKRRSDRYNYLLPLRVASLMRELREYCPDVVVELDITEHERALIGLIGLQEGKLFYMNNGASWYGDYSSFRTKSMRTITAQVCPLIPQEALTYSVYPFNAWPYHSLHYNLCTAAQAGHGYWGPLGKMKAADVKNTAYVTAQAKRVLEKVAGAPLRVNGTVGDSPEIYIQAKDGYALVTGFAGSPCTENVKVDLNPSKVSGVIGHAFSCSDGAVILPMQFSMPDDSRIAFIIGSEGSTARILSSTGWLRDISVKDGKLLITAGSDTVLEILTDSGKMKIELKAGQEITVE